MKVKPFASITTASRIDEVKKAVNRIKGAAVFVGIATGSKGDARSDGGPSNHELGFIHEFGSPAANIPERPFLRPGVRKAAPNYIPKLKAAMKAGLRGDGAAMERLLEQAGSIASSAVKVERATGKFGEMKHAIKPSTLRNRNRSRLTKSKRENEMNGVNVRPLINTGSLRNSIDWYVVKGK